jgi:hypothetical protein
MDISLITQITAHALGGKFAFGGTYQGDQRFPEGTRGFLYYNEPKAGVPPAAGDLRFRVTPGNTPASFVHGSDLLFQTGLPWSIPLLAMVKKQAVRKGQHYQPILQLLLDDGCVTPTLLETCATMVNSSRPRPLRSSRIIHSFGQLFPIMFEVSYLTFFALSMNQLQHQRHRLYHYYKIKDIIPYSGEYTKIAQFMPILLKSQPPGSALCCFERSNLPQHKGTRTVVIRIVKIISPVTCRYPDYPSRALPVEGGLLQHHRKRTGLQPFSFNVDLEGHMELQMLFRDES